jgi:hypothetical protein
MNDHIAAHTAVRLIITSTHPLKTNFVDFPVTLYYFHLLAISDYGYVYGAEVHKSWALGFRGDRILYVGSEYLSVFSIDLALFNLPGGYNFELNSTFWKVCASLSSDKPVLKAGLCSCPRFTIIFFMKWFCE